MFTFFINETATKFLVTTTRALLFFAAFTCFITVPKYSMWLPILLGALLILAAFFLPYFLQKNKHAITIIMLFASSCLILITGSFIVAGILFFGSVVLKKVYINPTIIFTHNDICITKTISKKYHKWNDCDNVVYKGGLLTIDFKNNRIIQLPINTGISGVDESTFNLFCKKKLNTFQSK